MSRDDVMRLTAYLGHIQEAIERCRRYVKDCDESAFLRDEKTQDAVIRTFEVIGEAANNIRKHYPDFAKAHAELPLGYAYEMRNALSHGYFKVDLEVVWKTIHGNLPELYADVKALIEELQAP